MQFFQTTILLFTNQDLLAKIILILLLSVYGLFTLILTNQVRILSKVVDQIHFSPIFLMLAYAHSLLSITFLLGVVLFL